MILKDKQAYDITTGRAGILCNSKSDDLIASLMRVRGVFVKIHRMSFLNR